MIGLRTPVFRGNFRLALWNTRHTSLGTLDFYFEHAHMKQLKAVGGGTR